jgi:Zn ribbon nucleic-acid-binding protein
MRKLTPLLMCPECHQQSGLPLAVPAASAVKLFECDACGHDWEVAKRRGDDPAKDPPPWFVPL